MADRDDQFSELVEEGNILRIPDIRDRLSPEDSPFVENNNAGGGYVASLPLGTVLQA